MSTDEAGQSGDFEFVAMRHEDVDVIHAAELSIYPFPWTRGNFTDSLDGGHVCLIMRENGVMVGYGVVMLAADEVHLLNLSILPQQQRRGLGHLLLKQFCRIAKGRGARRMLLEVRFSNVKARAFYDRLGFTVIGERRGYYAANEGRENAIVMAIDLTPVAAADKGDA